MVVTKFLVYLLVVVLQLSLVVDTLHGVVQKDKGCHSPQEHRHGAHRPV